VFGRRPGSGSDRQSQLGERRGDAQLRWDVHGEFVMSAVEALDSQRLLSHLTAVISDQQVNILSATVTTTRDRVAVSRFMFEMSDLKHLNRLLTAVRKIDGVYDACRVTSGV
jgi:(p)ppGpp synthase/HD superfamily hydrolase